MLVNWICHTKSEKFLKQTFEMVFEYKITLWICVLFLWIHKGYSVVKKLVWNVPIKAFWCTKNISSIGAYFFFFLIQFGYNLIWKTMDLPPLTKDIFHKDIKTNVSILWVSEFYREIHKKGMHLNHNFYVVVGKQCCTENAYMGHQYNIFIYIN